MYRDIYLTFDLGDTQREQMIEARVPIFQWDDNYRFGADDFDDPTTNVHDVAP